MPENSRFHRRSIRLQSYDYRSNGAYFVTICTHQRECMLGEIAADVFSLSGYGEIVAEVWCDLPDHYPNVELDAFVVMPNHIHAVIVIIDTVGAELSSAPTRAKHNPLSEIVRGFKAFSARRINELRNSPGNPVWQRNYYDHIVRSEKSLNAIREYILFNPARWASDRENPSNHQR